MANNPASILDSIKKVLGFDSEFTDFDLDIIMHTNTFLGSLHDLGVGPVEGYVISDNTQLWSDFSPNMQLLSAIQSYLFLKVRSVFDPPATSFVIEANDRLAAELECRILIKSEQINPPSDPFTGKPETIPTGIIN